MIRWLIIAMALIAGNAYADIVVGFIDESRLSYANSPRNYENSPNNYDNSINNYDNSPSNYENSSKNYDNASSNFDNGINGNRNILERNSGKVYRLGYFVHSESGVMNFYSRSGDRMFFNPATSNAVFHGTKGFYCGILARVDGELRLMLTEVGEKVLDLNQ